MSGSIISVVSCPRSFTEEWWFRQPKNTPAPCASGWNYIVPAYDFSLDFNVAGGNGTGRNIILIRRMAARVTEFGTSSS